MNVFQDLYDSEINFKISTFWDGGFDLWLGDDLNGYQAEGCVRTWDEVEKWFIDAAIKHYPDSVFARDYKTRAFAS